MTYQLSPSVLARTRSHFFDVRRQALALTPHIHVDIMDGDFTPTRSISAAVLRVGKLPASASVHLMVRQAAPWLEAVAKSGARRVIIHAETADVLEAIRVAKTKKLEVGIGIKLGSNLRGLRVFLPVRWVHLMDGPIGRYGTAFDHRTLSRIRAIRRQYPRAHLSCDVGLNPQTIPAVVEAGANEVIVGSYLWSARFPRQRWSILRAQQHIL